MIYDLLTTNSKTSGHVQKRAALDNWATINGRKEGRKGEESK